MMDLLRAGRAMPDFLKAARVHLVEMSPLLQAAQKRTLAPSGAEISWAAHIDEVPEGPTLLIANEFFDALPIVQLEKREQGFFERAVGLDGQGRLSLGLMPVPVPAPAFAQAADLGAVAEHSPASAIYAQAIAARAMRDATTRAERIARVFRLLAGRAPHDDELAPLTVLVASQAEAFATDLAAARAVSGSDDPEHAALVLAASTVMASDAFVMVR